MYPAEEGVATFVSSPVDSTCDPAKAKLTQWRNSEIQQPITVEIMVRRGPAYYRVTDKFLDSVAHRTSAKSRMESTTDYERHHARLRLQVVPFIAEELQFIVEQKVGDFELMVVAEAVLSLCDSAD